MTTTRDDTSPYQRPRQYGRLVTARKEYWCGGAGASAQRQGHTLAAGSPCFVFRRQFYYGGALYSGGVRICPDHAHKMGLLAGQEEETK